MPQYFAHGVEIACQLVHIRGRAMPKPVQARRKTISELITQVDGIADNILGIVMNLKNTSELTSSNGISRANVVLRIKHVFYLRKL